MYLRANCKTHVNVRAFFTLELQTIIKLITRFNAFLQKNTKTTGPSTTQNPQAGRAGEAIERKGAWGGAEVEWRRAGRGWEREGGGGGGRREGGGDGRGGGGVQAP